MPITLVVLSDTHGGHKLALMNPDVTLFDETEDGELVPYTPNSTSAQLYLWKLYTEYIAEVEEFAKGNEIIVLHNGDIAWGNKYPQQMVGTREADQVFIGVANLLPLLSLPNVTTLRLTIGTGAHTFSEGSAAMYVTRILQEKRSDLDIKTLYHGLATIANLEIDYAHKGPFPGSRKWLEGNNLRYYLRDIMERDLMDGKTPPGLFLRSHFHTYMDEVLSIHLGDRDVTSRITLTPSFMLMTDYAREVTRSRTHVTNGLVVYEIDNGAITKSARFTKTVDIRTKETLGASLWKDQKKMKKKPIKNLFKRRETKKK